MYVCVSGRHDFCSVSAQVESIPVAVLPGNFVPIRCKPPFCNPYLHNLAFGVDVEPGDDFLADGGIDFPIPLEAGGIGVRFPLNGGVNVASDPMLITYGHGLGPVDPFGDHESMHEPIDDDRRESKKKKKTVRVTINQRY